MEVVSDGKPAADDRAGELESVFKAGNEGRASLFEKGRNAAAAFSEITVPLKDVPGALLQVLSPLAQNNLNIRDIELMKVRENIAGTLLLAFKTPEEALQDMRAWHRRFRGIALAKRIQFPPILSVSGHAFGAEYPESQV